MRTKCVLEEAATHSGAEGEKPDAGSFGRLRGPYSEQWLVKDCTMVEVTTPYWTTLYSSTGPRTQFIAPRDLITSLLPGLEPSMLTQAHQLQTMHLESSASALFGFYYTWSKTFPVFLEDFRNY